MENILYLDDYINLYNSKIDKIITIKPYKKTLENGHIINKNKFIKNFNQIKINYKIPNNLFSESINIIINSSYTEEDKTLIKDIMEELNYKKINLINEINLIKMDKKILFINFNYSYFYFYIINDLGKTEIHIYKNNYINILLIKHIIKLLNKNKILIIGKNIKELINILEKEKYNYFYYEEHKNFYIKLALNIKNV